MRRGIRKPLMPDTDEVIYLSKEVYESLKIYLCKSCLDKESKPPKCLKCRSERLVHIGFWSPDGTNRELRIRE